MDLPPAYDDDLYAWALHQAEVLRRMKASGVALPNDLDLEHVAEEIEDLGNEQRFQVEGNLEQALAHLIKLVWQPANPAERHWMTEISAFLRNARRRYRPSMRRVLDPQEIWVAACGTAAIALGEDDGLPGLPGAMPLELEELLDPAATPRQLALRLASLLGKAAVTDKAP